MTLEARLNRIIAEQNITKREFARRVGMSEVAFKKEGHIKNPQRELAAAINAIPAR